VSTIEAERTLEQLLEDRAVRAMLHGQLDQRRGTINWPTSRVTKRATECGYIVRHAQRGGHPSFSPLGRAHTR
jgi:hypothetical protein